MTELFVAVRHVANALETNGDRKHCKYITAGFAGQGEEKCRF
jgi:hypothetical protein